jgi:hypothetical protein
VQLDTLSNAKEPQHKNVDLPHDITDLGSEQLAEMFTVLTVWADFFASKLTMAQIEEKEIEKRLEYETAKLTVQFLENATKTDKVSLAKAQIAIDPKIVELKDLQHERYAQRKAWELLLNNQERDITLVSREITRRTSDQRANRKDYI